jgi:superfamily II DNA or RNA helicase
VGPVIHRIRAEALIDAGVLAKPEITMTRVQASALDVATWGEAYDQLVVHSAKRNGVVLRCAEKAIKPCLLFVNHVEHGRILERLLRGKGTKVEFVWGKHKLATRRSAIERLVMGETDVLICNVIFQEGIDIPELQSVVIAQGGKSVIAALQRVGRGMRRRSRTGEVTKETFKVFDIKDVGCGCLAAKRHRACRWLISHTRHRAAAYNSERYQVIEDT